MSKNCNLSYEDGSFIIQGLSNENIIISNDGDIEVTSLVSSLVQQIDIGEEIRLNDMPSEPPLNEKQKIVKSLIENIFKSYNESLVDSKSSEDDDSED